MGLIIDLFFKYYLIDVPFPKLQQCRDKRKPPSALMFLTYHYFPIHSTICTSLPILQIYFMYLLYLLDIVLDVCIYHLYSLEQFTEKHDDEYGIRTH